MCRVILIGVAKQYVHIQSYMLYSISNLVVNIGCTHSDDGDDGDDVDDVR